MVGGTDTGAPCSCVRYELREAPDTFSKSIKTSPLQVSFTVVSPDCPFSAETLMTLSAPLWGMCALTQ